MTRLTKHFTLAEALKSETARARGISNAPNDKQLEAIKHTAEQMELVRQVLNSKPISPSSWFRNEQVNRAVGGVSNSDHMSGYAVDFACPGFGSPAEVCRAIVASGIKFDQLILEYGRWVHISFAPAMRQNVLHISKGTGYRTGLPS